jgi:hypothetical protein
MDTNAHDETEQRLMIARQPHRLGHIAGELTMARHGCCKRFSDALNSQWVARAAQSAHGRGITCRDDTEYRDQPGQRGKILLRSDIAWAPPAGRWPSPPTPKGASGANCRSGRIAPHAHPRCAASLVSAVLQRAGALRPDNPHDLFPARFLKSSSFLPVFSAAASHRGFSPRPAHVSVGLSGLRYLGATAPRRPPRTPLPRAPLAARRSNLLSWS